MNITPLKNILETAAKSPRHMQALWLVAAILFSSTWFFLIRTLHRLFNDDILIQRIIIIAGIFIFLALILIIVFRLPKPDPTKDRIQVAAICYKKENGVNKFLLQYTAEKDAWNFPKGNLDPIKDNAEKPCECAIRWARMESGVEAVCTAAHTDKPHEIWHVKIDQKSSPEAGEFPKVERIKLQVYILSFVSDAGGHKPERNPTWYTLQECEDVLKTGRSKKQADQFMNAIRYANSVI